MRSERFCPVVDSVKYWYAVVDMDRGDYDWGNGSYDKEEALKEAQETKKMYPDRRIVLATIEEVGDAMNVCVDEEEVE